MTKTDDAFTIESHFEGKDSVRRIYDRLLKEARRFGPVIEARKKTSIHLVNRTAFAGVATRRHALILTIKASANSQAHAFTNPNRRRPSGSTIK